MGSQGGVIMDVVNVEQARIAEEAGACAVMALERVPADIRATGGVARMVSSQSYPMEDGSPITRLLERPEYDQTDRGRRYNSCHGQSADRTFR